MNNQQWHEWEMTGLQVNYIRLSYQIDIHMALMEADASERDLLLVIESPFTLRPASGEPLCLDPGQPQTLFPLLPFLFRPVASFRASSAGECQLRFEDGTELSCLPDERYEAWNSRGSGELASASLLCGPGGGRPWG